MARLSDPDSETKEVLAAELRDQETDERQEEDDEIEVEPGHSSVQVVDSERQYTDPLTVFQRQSRFRDRTRPRET